MRGPRASHELNWQIGAEIIAWKPLVFDQAFAITAYFKQHLLRPGFRSWVLVKIKVSFSTYLGQSLKVFKFLSKVTEIVR